MSFGFTVIPVLHEHHGKPWCPITQAYLRALRPSVIRTVQDEVKSDAIIWRVTVYLTSDDFIWRIEQEVEVDLPDDIEHGADLECRMEALLRRSGER